MWISQDFSATQILREINFGHLKAPITDNLTIWTTLDFEFVETFDIFKCEIAQKKIKLQSLQKFSLSENSQNC